MTKLVEDGHEYPVEIRETLVEDNETLVLKPKLTQGKINIHKLLVHV
jgi:hypothetical protein